MTTLVDPLPVLPPAESPPYSRPRPSLASRAALHAAVVLMAEGVTAGALRADAVPGDGLLESVADAVDRLASGGMTPEKARFLLGGPAAGWTTPGRCSECWDRHPGSCDCKCHRPAAYAALPAAPENRLAAVLTGETPDGLPVCVIVPAPQASPESRENESTR